ncbi:hypothetical protein AMAG_07710 [Allomyces macrogynus ATCC 38327]|uniref:tRNA dimethylallyltransferase n=1 Tax=Allomyces macrogynus (strain ATCC 38327) TaxID=578462 RepID=A0A0L0SJ28_ALLM3|nr:hypothetical protein AMAG_07710 [Allomyces macrogynus ATCC 38327]|eukprot:KNE62498.1 hypothetical protein AMAG_07710 [Allomyces macrogynus ATCC 38327]
MRPATTFLATILAWTRRTLAAATQRLNWSSNAMTDLPAAGTATAVTAATAIPLLAVVGRYAPPALNKHLRPLDADHVPHLDQPCSTTGTGKSDLAIHLAQQLGGEAINSDTLQVYRALDTVTNKVSQEDRTKVPRHLMDLREHTDAPYSVRDFERDASVPVVVGGTHYYLQYLLWGDDTATTFDSDPTPNVDESQYLPAAVRASLDDPAALHAHLTSIDPTAAARWLPNDTRRVQRTL